MGQNNINSSEIAEIFMLQFLCAEIVILILAVFFFTFFVNKHLIKEALGETFARAAGLIIILLKISLTLI